eukprot:403338099
MESYKHQQNILFTDPQFPADLSSLFNERNELKEDSQIYMLSLTWKRASEVLGNIGIENENIQPNDIKQGSIGNCYFLSALSSLAQYPERVLNMFENLQEQKIGKYTIRFYIQGEPKLITIDDFIPVRSDNLPAFCHSQRNKVWPIILEKAWAKLHNGYQNSGAGHTDVALSYLTGAPCKYVDNVKLGHNLWQTLLDSDKKLHIIASSVSMQKEEFKEIFKDNGLSNNHAYSVIKLQTAQLQDGKEERLINLRNPWGKREFNGDWNKNDQRWTDDLKKKLAYEYLKDGEFWMSIFDFSTQFKHSQICMVNDFFQRNFVKLQAKKGQFYAFEFTVRQELDFEELHLIAYQMDSKIGGIQYGAFDYSEVQMLIGRKETNQTIMNQFPIEYVASRKAQKYETAISNFEILIPGTYVLLLEVDWVQSFTQDIVIAAYSAQDIKLTQVQYDHSMLENMLKSWQNKHSGKIKFNYRLLAEEDNNELLTQVLTYGRLQQQNFHGRIIGVNLYDLCYKNGYLIYVENQTNIPGTSKFIKFEAINKESQIKFSYIYKFDIQDL